MMTSSMQPVVLPSDATGFPATYDIRRIIRFLPETPGCSPPTATGRCVSRTFGNAAADADPLAAQSGQLAVQRCCQVIDRHLLSEVRSAASGLPVPSLTAVLRTTFCKDILRLSSWPTKIRASAESAPVDSPGQSSMPFSVSSGYSVNAEAKAPRHIQTLYNQRTAGLKKWWNIILSWQPVSPAARPKGRKDQPDAALSALSANLSTRFTVGKFSRSSSPSLTIGCG